MQPRDEMYDAMGGCGPDARAWPQRWGRSALTGSWPGAGFGTRT
ncbi:MAG: hypothetical protein WCF04_15235 [Candidatus Nanopelagicales bacterium]